MAIPVLTSAWARTALGALPSSLEVEGASHWQPVAALGVLTIPPVFIFMGAMHRFTVRGPILWTLKG